MFTTDAQLLRIAPLIAILQGHKKLVEASPKIKAQTSPSLPPSPSSAYQPLALLLTSSSAACALAPSLAAAPSSLFLFFSCCSCSSCCCASRACLAASRALSLKVMPRVSVLNSYGRPHTRGGVRGHHRVQGREMRHSRSHACKPSP